MANYVWLTGYHVNDVDGSPICVVVGRDTKTREVKQFGVMDFKPYFYAADSNGDLLSCYGDKIKKVICEHPSQIRNKREDYDKTFEADILYDMRYVIDKGIYYGFDDKMQPVELTDVVMPRILYFDIEVIVPETEGIDVENPAHPICAISCLDSYTQETTIFTLNYELVDGYNQENFVSERDMLQAFAEYVDLYDYDVITGWYSEGFDIPYIMNRAKRIGADISKFSRTKHIPPNPFRFPGRIRVDMYEFFKDWSKPMGQLPTYDLKYVSCLAGFSYKDYGDKIEQMIEEKRFKELLDYSTYDVAALALIDEHYGLMRYHEALRKLVGIKLDDAISRTKIIEYFLMRLGIKPIPTKEKFEKQDFEGAYVVQPTPGIKRWTACFDLKALYPSILIALNLSPDIDKMIPKSIIYVMQEREKLRAKRLAGDTSEILATNEQSLKYVANAFYGYLGSIFAKLYAPEIAATVTKYGRDITAELRELLESKGYHVEYGDTDSTFVSTISTVDEGKEVEKMLNAFLKEWAVKQNIPDGLEPVIKFEKLYSDIFFKKKTGSEEAAKKNYAGRLVWKDGRDVDKLDYTGISIRRSDTAKLTKRTMEEFFKYTLVEKDVNKACEVVKEAIDDVENGRVSIHDVAIPKGVKNLDWNNAWTRGVKNGIEFLGLRFNPSKKPKLIYCKYPVDVVCIDDDITDEEFHRKFNVDWKKMATKTIDAKFRSFVESLDMKWEEEMMGQITWEAVLGTPTAEQQIRMRRMSKRCRKYT